MYNKKDWLKNQEKTEKDVIKYESEWLKNEKYIEGVVFSDDIYFGWSERRMDMRVHEWNYILTKRMNFFNLHDL